LLGAAFGLGFVLGPGIGGLLGSIGPRVPFFVAACVVLLNMMWGLFVLPESLPAERRSAFTTRDLNPLAALRHLRLHPLLPSLAVVFVLMAFGQRGIESVWVLYTGWRYGWGTLETGLSLLVVGLAGVIVQGGLVRWIVPGLGEARALILALALQVVAFTLYGSVPSGWMVFLVVPIGALAAIATPALQALVTSVVPSDRQGSVQGALASLQSFVWIPAPIVASYLFAFGTDGTLPLIVPGLPFYLGATCSLLALMWAARTLARRPQMT
jgi:DHA1 family tetracycline resistance protein-like MFS transporter